MKKLYPWRRLWAPEGTTLFSSDDGFVLDPAEHERFPFNAALSILEGLAQRCLVLLGEPGMGKSTELAAYVSLLNDRVSGTKDEVLFKNLKRYTTDQFLVTDLFQDPTYKDWLAGNHTLYLCLDSFDEVQLRVETVVSLLMDDLKTAPVDRLFLRIACRGAEWPPSFGEQLASLWPKQESSPDNPHYAVYSLVPLTQTNIRVAAEHENLDAAAFMAAIREARVAGLAQRPLTLGFLLASFRESGSLPRRRRVLFEEGCRRLCKEWNPSRAQGRSKLSPDQRLAVAARLAAVSQLSNRPTFSLSTALEDPPTGALELRDLSGGKELRHGDSFLVDEAAVQETLQTALFEGRSDGTVEWAHQSYAEFLAARCLLNLGLPLSKLRSLLSHPTTGTIVPQLREVASAVAEERGDFLSAILDSDDPTILLRTDLAEAEAHVKDRLVGRLLELLDRHEVTSVDPSGLQNLAHPGLAEQLRPYILKGSESRKVSAVAFEIAGSCGVRELLPELLQVAKNAEETPYRRRLAIGAVAKMATPAVWVPEIKPLLDIPADEDPDDDIKGELLSVLWPEHLAAEELFRCLVAPQKESLVGRYFEFFDGRLTAGLRPESLPIALQWAARHPPSSAQHSAFRLANKSILLRAWDLLSHEGVLEALSHVALAHAREHLPLLEPAYAEQYARPVLDLPQGRRKIIQHLVEAKSEEEFLLTNVTYLDWPLRLVLVADLEWLLSRAETSSVLEIQLRWLKLFTCHIRQAGHPLTERFLTTVSSADDLRQHLADYVGPVAIASDHASYNRSRRQDEQVENEADQQEKARITEALVESEQGRSVAWQIIPIDVHLVEGELWRHTPSWTIPDLRDFRLWRVSDTETRQRLVQAARRFLEDANLEPEGWFGRNRINHRARAGYMALRLLLEEEPALLDRLPPEIWARWTPALVDRHFNFGPGDRQAHKILLQRTAQLAPDSLSEWVLRLVAMDRLEGRSLEVLQDLGSWWRPKLEAGLMEVLTDPTLAPKTFGRLLLILLSRGNQETLDHASSLLKSRLPPRGKPRERALHAAAALLQHDPEHVWPLIAKRLDHGRKFVEELVDLLASERYKVGHALEEVHVAELSIWLSRASRQKSIHRGILATPLALARSAGSVTTCCRDFPPPARGRRSPRWSTLQTGVPSSRG